MTGFVGDNTVPSLWTAATSCGSGFVSVTTVSAVKSVLGLETCNTGGGGGSTDEGGTAKGKK